MAKGARASTVKRNNANLRAKIFGPAQDARTERLSAKLLEIASKPRPDEERRMEVDHQEEQDAPTEQSTNANGTNEMDVDGQVTKRKTGKSSRNGRTHSSRRPEHKIAKRKAKNSIVFRHDVARRKRQAKQKKR